VIRILDITQKDLLQLMRDRKTFMFLLIMPVAFTLLFGYAFGGFGGSSDSRLPVGYLDQDNSRLSRKLHDVLAASKIIRLDENQVRSVSDLEQLVTQEKLAAAIVIPAGYGKTSLEGKHARLVLIGGDASTSVGTGIQAEVLAAANRLDSAVSAALSMEQVTQAGLPFNYAFDQALSAWDKPPIAIAETTSTAIKQQDNQTTSLTHNSPGFMLQFAIAGLLTAAQVIVTERKTRALQRLLTTATRRIHILLGHYLAILTLILGELLLLILFGQLALKVDYAREAGATLVVALSAASCIAAMGLLIGVLARSDEQAVIFSLIPMFVFSGLGGAWVPLEVTGATFQAIGHVSPIAWAMDGFKNITTRGLGISSALLPASALIGYAALFFSLAAWRFWASEEH
jgi:ABC-2 type transport system permease protein